MRILVIGGTGTVGSEVVRGLLGKGENVRVLTRDPARTRDLPQRAEGAVGDLTRPESLRDAFSGVDAVFTATPLSPTETEEGLAAVKTAQEARVRRFVYMSVHNVAEAPEIPHFRSKVPVEQAVRASRMEWSLLQPNNFYQNDYWFRDAIMHGIYPQPIGGVGLSRVDVRDIAEGAVIALTQSGHEGRSYVLAGPEALTGDDVAAVYTRHLGREVRYAGDDLDVWQAGALKAFPAWLVHDFRIMYGWFQDNGLRATGRDLALLTKLLGHEPRRFDAFVAETVPAWKGRSASS